MNNQQLNQLLDELIPAYNQIGEVIRLIQQALPVAPAVAPVVTDDGDRSLTAFLNMVKRGNFVILDTETTGLTEGEICQIAIINAGGEILLDSLVKTKQSIPGEASRIHGLYDKDVKDAPTWVDLQSRVAQLLQGRDLIVYNAVYDRKMMHQTAERWGLPKTEWKSVARWWCAMEAFAEVYGDYNSYRQSYRWQKLTVAAQYYKLSTDGAHTALADCRMTLGVVKAMAAAGAK